ncbi:lysophospholipid acyltransferase family protein [Rhodoferax ferrireducens]|uniref:lysophospholipid acyltransferase family protein n=1 Tax=Rhodoferax ferrireducens TaxID=192843 RepID=UPI000E0CD2A8|nr:lysophospholipid acyltransferase family protein [Rhodoferax ferrireducens]
MITLFKILSVLPLWLAHGLGWGMGWLVFAISGVYRRRFLANARQAGMVWQQWLGAVGESGKLVAELPRLWLGRPVPVQWDGARHVEAALALGRGVVFLTPHLGCFEITAQAYAQRYGQDKEPMTVLFRPPRQSWLRELVTTARARPGLHTAPTTLAGVKQMIKALKKGQSLGLLPDQVPPLGLGLWVPFFGSDAYTMTLSVRLAQQTGATVLMAWGERLSWGRGYRVHVQPLGAALPTDGVQAAAHINRAMEGLIRSCPQQYLWGYARYKQPRQEL